MWGAQEKSGAHQKNFGRREAAPTCKLLPTPLRARPIAMPMTYRSGVINSGALGHVTSTPSRRVINSAKNVGCFRLSFHPPARYL